MSKDVQRPYSRIRCHVLPRLSVSVPMPLLKVTDTPINVRFSFCSEFSLIAGVMIGLCEDDAVSSLSCANE